MDLGVVGRMVGGCKGRPSMGVAIHSDAVGFTWVLLQQPLAMEEPEQVLPEGQSKSECCFASGGAAAASARPSLLLQLPAPSCHHQSQVLW